MTQVPNMPPNAPPEPLDADERELARLLRTLPAAAPPPELDARILGAARRAVHRPQRRKRSTGWLVGLGTAASALLALGLFMRMHDANDASMYTLPSDAMSETPAHAPMPGGETRAAKEQARPAATANAAPDAAAAPAAQPPAEAIPGANAARERDSDNFSAAAQPARQQAQGIAQHADAKALAARPTPNAFPEAEAPKPVPSPMMRAAVPPPAAAPAAPAIANQPAMAAAPPPPPRPAANEQQAERKSDSGLVAGREESAAATGSLKKDERGPAKQKAAPADKLAAPASTAQAAGGNAAKTLDRVDVTGSRIKRAADTEPAQPVTTLTRNDIVPAGDAASGASAWTGKPSSGVPAGSADRDGARGYAAHSTAAQDNDPEPNDGEKARLTANIDGDMALPPAKWIERIRARLHAGYRQGARESLQRFQAHYPDEDIPADLQPLLK